MASPTNEDKLAGSGHGRPPRKVPDYLIPADQGGKKTPMETALRALHIEIMLAIFNPWLVYVFLGLAAFCTAMIANSDICYFALQVTGGPERFWWLLGYVGLLLAIAAVADNAVKRKRAAQSKWRTIIREERRFVAEMAQRMIDLKGEAEKIMTTLRRDDEVALSRVHLFLNVLLQDIKSRQRYESKFEYKDLGPWIDSAISQGCPLLMPAAQKEYCDALNIDTSTHGDPKQRLGKVGERIVGFRDWLKPDHVQRTAAAQPSTPSSS